MNSHRNPRRRSYAIAAGTVFGFTLLSIGLPQLSATAFTADQGIEVDTNTFRHHCDDGKFVTATYMPEDDTVAVTVDGKTTKFTSVVAASGARYEATGPTGTTTWWNQGNESILFHENGAGPDTDTPVTTCQEIG